MREALAGLELSTPEGIVRVDANNQHLYRHLRIGQVMPDGLIHTIETLGPIKPDPYLEGYDWAKEFNIKE